MHGLIVSPTVVQARKGTIAEVARVTFPGRNDDCARVGTGVCVMGVGSPGTVCRVASAACATGGMCRRRGRRVHNVLWVRGHAIIGFDRRPRTTRGIGSSRWIALERLNWGRDELLLLLLGVVSRCLWVQVGRGVGCRVRARRRARGRVMVDGGPLRRGRVIRVMVGRRGLRGIG